MDLVWEEGIAGIGKGQDRVKNRVRGGRTSGPLPCWILNSIWGQKARHGVSEVCTGKTASANLGNPILKLSL